MKFDAHIFDVPLNPRFQKTPQRERNGRVNCSSNELLHHQLTSLNSLLTRELDFGEMNRYALYAEQYGLFSKLLRLPTENFQLFAGSDDAIKCLLTALRKRFATLIIQTPNYENYFLYAQLNQFEIRPWKMNADFSFDLDTGLSLLKNSGSSVLVITSPNGYSGSLIDEDSVRRIVRYAYDCGSVVILDEAYAPFSDADYGHLPLDFENVALVSTFSKGFGLAGARFAYISASPPLIRYLGEWNGHNGISALSYRMAEAYLSRRDVFSAILSEIKSERESFTQFIARQTPWTAFPSHGNFVLVQLRPPSSAKDMDAYFWNHGVLIKLLDTPPFLNCVRITVGDCEIMSTIKRLILQYLREAQSELRRRV